MEIGADAVVVSRVIHAKKYDISTALFTTCADGVTHDKGTFALFEERVTGSRNGIQRHFTVTVDGYHSNTEARITAKAALAVERFFDAPLRFDLDLIVKGKSHMDVVAETIWSRSRRSFVFAKPWSCN